MILQTAATEAFSLTSSPKISTAPPPVTTTGSDTGSTGGGPAVPSAVPAARPVDARRASPTTCCRPTASAPDQWGCLDDLWQQESGWNYEAENASGAYGIPQALPGSKMASAGPDWETDPTTQIKWGLGYIKGDYGTPCGAWDHEEADGWY